MVAAGPRRIEPNHRCRPEPALSICVAETFSQPAPSPPLPLLVIGREPSMYTLCVLRRLARYAGPKLHWRQRLGDEWASNLGCGP